MSKSKNHHWWPKRLQARYWADFDGKVCWVDPDGRPQEKNPNNNRTGQKLRGHKILPGKVWATNFEDEFQIDNYMHEIISRIRKMVPPDEVFFTSDENHKPFGQDARSGDGAVCFNHVEETLHRKLLEFLLSLLIRSPAKRERYNSAPQLIGLPPDEEAGKANMNSAFNTAQNLCRKGSIRNQFFVLLHSPSAQFVFGDGCLDWMTDSLSANRLEGKALVPFTPEICVYVCTSLKMNASYNCASLIAEPWMIKRVAEITQIYSKEYLFFKGERPELTDEFRCNRFLEHSPRFDPLIEHLDRVIDRNS